MTTLNLIERVSTLNVCILMQDKSHSAPPQCWVLLVCECETMEQKLVAH
jgi:hypothetical protein